MSPRDQILVPPRMAHVAFSEQLEQEICATISDVESNQVASVHRQAIGMSAVVLLGLLEGAENFADDPFALRAEHIDLLEGYVDSLDGRSFVSADLWDLSVRAGAQAAAETDGFLNNLAYHATSFVKVGMTIDRAMSAYDPEQDTPLSAEDASVAAGLGILSALSDLRGERSEDAKRVLSARGLKNVAGAQPFMDMFHTSRMINLIPALESEVEMTPEMA